MTGKIYKNGLILLCGAGETLFIIEIALEAVGQVQQLAVFRLIAKPRWLFRCHSSSASEHLYIVPDNLVQVKIVGGLRRKIARQSLKGRTKHSRNHVKHKGKSDDGQ